MNKIKKLKNKIRLKKIQDYDFNILVKNSIKEKKWEISEKLNTTLIGVDLISAVGGDPAWSKSLTKFIVFNQTKYERIVYLDCDSIVKDDISYLFDLPQHFLYMPSAYWLDSYNFGTSALMVLIPSNEAYNQLISASRNSMFDMDIINELFKYRLKLLKDPLFVLNGDFIPSATSPSKFKGYTIEKLYNYTKIVHFSESHLGGYGKPWNSPGFVVQNDDSHHSYSKFFNLFWEKQKIYCAHTIYPW